MRLRIIFVLLISAFLLSMSANSQDQFISTSVNESFGLPSKMAPSINESAYGKDSDGDGITDSEEISGALHYKTNPNKADTDDDGLSDLREIWWLCDPTNPDTTGTGMTDGKKLANKMPPFPHERLNETTDWDGDGIPNLAEYNEIGTDPKKYSTDGDQFSDGDEFFGLNMPSIAPTDHYFVAASPKISIELIRLNVAPIYSIQSKTGRILNNNWSITEETNDKHDGSFKIDPGFRLDLKELISGGVLNPEALAKAFSINVQGSLGWGDANIVTIKNSTSGWDQTDWSTVINSDTGRAAVLTAVLKVSNVGCQPAKEISFDLNMQLGDIPIKKISIRDDKAIHSLKPSESAELVINDIFVSIDQLRCIDTGVPLKLIPTNVDYRVKSWDGKQWIETTTSFSNYMEEIDKSTSTLIFSPDDQVNREYKVYAGTDQKPISLREAMNLTIFRDYNLSSMINRSLQLVIPSDAMVSAIKLNRTNGSIFDLKLKSGWVIVLRMQRSDTNPQIHWAQISNDRANISTAVTAEDGIKSVHAHLMINGRYQNISLINATGSGMIFKASLNNMKLEDLVSGKEAYIIATDRDDDSVTYPIWFIAVPSGCGIRLNNIIS